MKPKACKVCREKFHPVRPLQSCCSVDCAIQHSRKLSDAKAAKDASERRAAHRIAKVKARTLKEWLDEAQVLCNRYIRLRDGNKCISCGTENPAIQYAAGHFRSRGAASHLRFSEDNINTQCNYQCNSVLAGNIAKYRPALIAKIGIDRVEKLENDNTPHKWTIDEAKEKIIYFKNKLKEIASL